VTIASDDRQLFFRNPSDLELPIRGKQIAVETTGYEPRHRRIASSRGSQEDFVMKTRILGAVLVLLAATAPAFAQSNLEIFRGIEKQVLQYPHFTIFDSVNSEINDGVVTLTGKVTMGYKRSDLERRIAKVPGVSKVVNQITILPASQFDDELRFRVARAIYSNPALQMYAHQVNPPIHVIVEHGHITLEGVVLNHMDRVIARAAASNFLAFSVKNELKTDEEAKKELEKL
jgi:osmotically-inducible protein OsmY